MVVGYGVKIFGPRYLITSSDHLEFSSELCDVLFCFCQVSKKFVEKEVCSQIHEKVAPFIKWLKEAEEEESSEEEEEEVEVVYDTKAQQLKAHVDNTAGHEEDDDLDIDAI